MAREVGGDAGGLPDDGDASGAGGGVAGVLVGALGVLVQEALDHDEVLGDVLGVVPAQGPQLGAGAALEVRRVDVLGQGGCADA